MGKNFKLEIYVYCSFQARHYYQIIKKPMDLSVIRNKLNRRSHSHYYTPQEFVADVFLMFRNCAKFNYVSSTCFEVVHSLAKAFCELCLFLLFQ